jgi:hypothetical protein
VAEALRVNESPLPETIQDCSLVWKLLPAEVETWAWALDRRYWAEETAEKARKATERAKQRIRFQPKYNNQL